ncbi:MAG: hypothetical protein ACLT76_10795 [Clostridium fessum]
MNLLELCNLQGSLFLMILAGAVLKRRGIISKEGEKCLTGSLREYRDSLQYCEIVPDFI